jgi:hypothetical protein
VRHSVGCDKLNPPRQEADVIVGVGPLRAAERARPLDRCGARSLYVLVSMETLKDASAAGWRVHACCLDGEVDNAASLDVGPIAKT